MICLLSPSMPEQAAIATVIADLCNPATLQWLDDHDPQGRLYRIARYVQIKQEVAL
jgi:hypothetical protein